MIKDLTNNVKSIIVVRNKESMRNHWLFCRYTRITMSRRHASMVRRLDILLFLLFPVLLKAKFSNKQGITEKPFLLGHSMGGAVVQKYIGAYSDTVKGAILFASATGGGMDFGKTLKDCFTHKNLFTATLVANLGTRLLTFNAIYKSAFFDKRINKERSKIYKESLHKESIKITFIDLYQEYTKNYNVDIPILVIGSYADSYFPEESLLKTARVYGCTENDAKRNLKILPDLCHDMMLDEVDEGWKKSAKAVLDFMKNNK